MPSVRSRLVRFWMARFLKPKFHSSTSAEQLRQIVDGLTRWGRQPAGSSVQETRIAGCAAEWHVPREDSADHVVLYLHGGGYNFGSAANYRELGSRLSICCQARVLIPDYRLAPEHPYPAAVEDAAACYRELLEQHVSTERLAVAGDSAGGGLTLALLLKLKRDGLPLPAVAACLSPWIDLRCSGESYKSLCEADPMLTRELLQGCAERYAAGGDLSDYLMSPVHGNFNGLPPLLIQVGSDEILLSDSERLHKAARAAGVDVRFDVLEGLWHVVHLFASAVPEARQAIGDVGNFMRRHWDAD